MPTIAVYGTMWFPGRNQRDRMDTQLRSEAAARGFVAGPYPPDYPTGGNRAYQSPAGDWALDFCWLHADQAAVDAAMVALDGLSKGNGRRSDGNADLFSSGYVSDLDPPAYLAGL